MPRRHHNCSLTIDDELEVLKDLLIRKWSLRETARVWGTSKTTIQRIRDAWFGLLFEHKARDIEI